MSQNQKVNLSPCFKPKLKPIFFLLNRLPGMTAATASNSSGSHSTPRPRFIMNWYATFSTSPAAITTCNGEEV